MYCNGLLLVMCQLAKLLVKMAQAQSNPSLVLMDYNFVKFFKDDHSWDTLCSAKVRSDSLQVSFLRKMKNKYSYPLNFLLHFVSLQSKTLIYYTSILSREVPNSILGSDLIF